MGGTSGGSQTSSSQPWKEQKPYLTYGFDQASQLYKSSNPSYYEGSTVAPLSDTTQQAMQLQQMRALGGNQATNAGQNQLTSTINGDYLNSNPYMDANFKAGTDAITSAYGDAVRGNTASFAGSGRLGSGMQAFYNNQADDTLAKNLNNLAGQTYFQNYNNERSNQMNAMGMAPAYAAQDYTDLDALSNVGAAQDTNNQNILNANIDRWNYNQNLGQNKLNQYMGLVQGNYGSTETTSTPSGGSTLGNILGTGFQLASMIPKGGFSDERLKENIEPAGKENGHNVYMFNYVGNPKEKYIGVMAQEVEKTNPEAVFQIGGIKRVMYDKIGVALRKV